MSSRQTSVGDCEGYGSITPTNLRRTTALRADVILGGGGGTQRCTKHERTRSADQTNTLSKQTKTKQRRAMVTTEPRNCQLPSREGAYGCAQVGFGRDADRGCRSNDYHRRVDHMVGLSRDSRLKPISPKFGKHRLATSCASRIHQGRGGRSRGGMRTSSSATSSVTCGEVLQGSVEEQSPRPGVCKCLSVRAIMSPYLRTAPR